MIGNRQANATILDRLLESVSEIEVDDLTRRLRLKHALLEESQR